MVQKKSEDLKKIWGETKKEFSKLSKDAVILLKKGEKEAVRFSEKGKLNFENTLLKLKKEQIYYTLGKEAVKAYKKNQPDSATLRRLMGQLDAIDKQVSSNKKALKKV